ncbi:MAG: RNA polymerase sigma factor [Acidobacteria bacterium]|nr:RNA polymerase sigma factor [Acidobacteriota bacterium]
MSLHRNKALETLLEEFGHILRRAIRGVVSGYPGVDAEEVEQEARIRVWQALARKGELEQPEAYLYRVAVTATFDALRRLKARREEGLAAAEGPKALPFPTERRNPERAAMDRQRLQQVRLALEGLAANRRSAVRLHLQGFTTEEIGRLKGWTEAKARNLVYRGLSDLRSLLEEDVREVV